MGWLAWRAKSHLTIIIGPPIDFVMNRTLSRERKQSGSWFEQMSSTMAQQQENILHLSKYAFAQFMSWEHSVRWKINLLREQWSALYEPKVLGLVCTAQSSGPGAWSIAGLERNRGKEVDSSNWPCGREGRKGGVALQQQEVGRTNTLWAL